MGMSSSQARLLTLTARMHDIEYRAQRLEAQKLQMANESRRAYEDYLNELDRTKLEAKVIGQDGSMTAISFTADAVYTYKQLMNQYALTTADGKALIPQEYHSAYSETETLHDYLERFGVASTVSVVTRTWEEDNPEYSAALERYEDDRQNWNDYNRYLDDLEDWQNRAVPMPDRADYTSVVTNYNYSEQFGAITARSQIYGVENWGNGPNFVFGTFQQIFASVIDYVDGKGYDPNDRLADRNDDGTYTSRGSDVLSSHSYDYGGVVRYAGGVNENWYNSDENSYTTSTGETISIDKHDISGQFSMTGNYGGTGYPSTTHTVCLHNSDRYTHNPPDECDIQEKWDMLAEISEKLNEKDENGNYKFLAYANSGETCDVTESSTAEQKLASKWNVDGSLKSMKQWAIDLYCLARSYSDDVIKNPDNTWNMPPELTDPNNSNYVDIRGLLQSFIGSFTDTHEEFDQEGYDRAMDEYEDYMRERPVWNDSIPEEPNREDYIRGIPEMVEKSESSEVTSFTDKNYAQWLINIWHKCQGQDEVPPIEQTTYTDEEGNTVKVYTVENKGKTSPQAEGINKYTNDYENENYIMIPQDKLKDPEWLKNTILEGWVIIQQFDQKGNKFNDTSVAVDTHLQEVADERSLKKAEAKYEADMRRIDQKDRRYDTQLAALDTERNAVKQEMETLKTVARDNVDRTFKLFS